jgi:hypothetical protein
MVSGASRPFSTWNHSSSSETVPSGIAIDREHTTPLGRQLANLAAAEQPTLEGGHDLLTVGHHGRRG